MKEGVAVSENRSARRKRKSKTKNKKFKYVVITTFALIFVLAFGVTFWGFSLINKVDINPITDKNKPEDVGITPDIKKVIQDTGKADEIRNIALFGTDQLDVKEPGRSDFIMILSIDEAHKKIKMSSIMRDSYVNIEGHGLDKINHAYAYGGPKLAVKTLNQSFGMNITDYVTVNFFSMEKIVNNLGGLVIDVKSSELQDLNLYIKEMADAAKRKPEYIPRAGSQKLNGIQTVAYVRNRSWGKGDDFERSERQKKVLSMLFEKVQTAGLTKYPGLVSDLAEYVSTSLSVSEMLKLGTDVLTSGIRTLDQDRFPVDGYHNGTYIKDVWYLKFDQKATQEQLRKYIYEDIKPTPKK
jgi:polyisoprenyl-teichoic acid--peptidoglycan teichoic acid transferase